MPHSFVPPLIQIVRSGFVRAIISLLLIAASLHASAACTLNAKKGSVQFGVSQSQHKIFEPQQEFILEGCDGSDFGKFLGIGLSPNVISASGIRYNSFNGLLRPFQCTMTDSQMRPLDSFQEIENNFKRKNDFFRECIQIEASSRESGLSASGQSSFCKIEILDKNRLRMQGSLCFLKITQEEPIKITLKVNPDCKGQNSELQLASHGEHPPLFNLFDIEGTLAFYYAQQSNKPSQMEILSVILLRDLFFFNEAPDEIVRLDKNYGQHDIRLPLEIQPEIHLGELKIENHPLNEGQILNMTLFSDNRCEQKCINDLCASRCDYSIPLGAVIKLFERSKNSHWRLLDMWYQRAIVPPQWAGQVLLPSRIWESSRFERGHEYRLVMDIDRTDLNFRAALENDKSTSGKINLDPFDDLVMKDQRPLPPLRPWPETKEDFPTLPFFSDDVNYETLLRQSSDQPFVELFYKPLKDHQRDFQIYNHWPPFYRYYCGLHQIDRSECIDMNTGKHGQKPAQMKLSVEFKVDANPLNPREIQLRDFIVRRESSFLKSYEQHLQSPPRILCSPIRSVSTLDLSEDFGFNSLSPRW